MTLKITNLNHSLRFSHIFRLFSYFGEIAAVGLTDADYGFLIKYKENEVEEKCLILEGYPFVKKPLMIKKIQNVDLIELKDSMEIVVKNFAGTEGDLIDEIQKYGNTKEVQKIGDNFYIKCRSFRDTNQIFLNIFGRFFDKKRIKCELN